MAKKKRYMTLTIRYSVEGDERMAAAELKRDIKKNHRILHGCCGGLYKFHAVSRTAKVTLEEEPHHEPTPEPGR